MTTKLWRWKATIGWARVRDCDDDTADEWLRRFSHAEPGVLFKISARKPPARSTRAGVRVEHGCLSWSGQTFGEARAARDADLARYFTAGEDIPTLVFVKSYVGVVFQRHTGDFSYRYYENGRPGAFITSAGWSRQDAEFRLRRHLAQNVFATDPATGEATCDGLDVVHPKDKEGLIEHRRWVAWQIAYGKARLAGATDEEARRAAGNHRDPVAKIE